MKHAVVFALSVVSFLCAHEASARWDEGGPRLNGPRAFGATPGKFFLYAFPTCGSRENLCYSLSDGHLPDGVTLDSRTGVLSGRAVESGAHSFVVRVENAQGWCEKPFTLVVKRGAMALTPPMGWTSWNAYTQDVDRERIEANARALVEKGLAAYGYAYVNIDSCWQGDRDEVSHALQPNSRFSDMSGLVAKLHKMGLKVGIYSTPMVVAWGSDESRLFRGGSGYPLDPVHFHGHFGGCGKIGYEREDAVQFSKWGMDWLKYDWPTTDIEHTRRMREALDESDRDIVLQVCTQCKIKDASAYEEMSSLVRGSPDTKDDWHYLITGEPQNKRELFKAADAWLDHIRPGFWYDLDMLALGRMRAFRTKHARKIGERTPEEFENRLSRIEQESHFAWWAILPAPLFVSCDLTQIDDFTLDLVTNEELLSINQDYPAKPARYVDMDGGRRRVWERTLSNGDRVLAFFNLGDDVWIVRRKLAGRFAVRDVLRHTNRGFLDAVEVELQPHGCNVFVLSFKGECN